MSRSTRYVRLVIMVALGVFAVVAGEADDSPGLQGIGLLLIILAVVLHWRGRRRCERNEP